MDKQLTAGNIGAMLAYRAQIDSAAMAHPTEDHLMPLYVAMGAGMSDGDAEKLHSSFTFGSLSMASYGWGM